MIGASQVQVNLKVAGLLGKYLPAGAENNTAALDVSDESTVLDVMTQLGLPPEHRYLVILNGANVPTSARGETIVNDGDDLSIMPPLKGG